MTRLSQRSEARTGLPCQVKRLLGFVCLALFVIGMFYASPADAQFDAEWIIQRSLQANAMDWDAVSDYDYRERDWQPDGGSKCYEVRMMVGSPYERLVAVNDKPLTPEQEAREQEKLEGAMARRQQESERERTERIARYERDRKRDHLLMDQLPKAFNFTLVGEQRLDGHDVYVLRATPRPGYQPPSVEAKVLTGMEGTLWIDKATFQWVKVEAQVIHPVSIAGFLARVEPGTQFDLEKMPIEGQIWLPKHFGMKSRARVFLFFPRKSEADESYFDYHRSAPSCGPGQSPRQDHGCSESRAR